MNPNNIFSDKPSFGKKVTAVNLPKNKSRQTPFSNPNDEKKKKKPAKPNGLLDANEDAINPENSSSNLLDTIIGYLLALIGRKKEWLETKNKINMIQKRIETFEKAINTTKVSSRFGSKFSNYNV